MVFSKAEGMGEKDKVCKKLVCQAWDTQSPFKGYTEKSCLREEKKGRKKKEEEGKKKGR